MKAPVPCSVPPCCAMALKRRSDRSRRQAQTVAHRVGQFQSVHASGHVNVREQQRNVRARFQQCNRFVRISGLERYESCFLDDFDGKHPQQRFVLHDEHNRRGFARRCFHHVNEAKRSGHRCAPRRTRLAYSPLHGTIALPS